MLSEKDIKIFYMILSNKNFRSHQFLIWCFVVASAFLISMNSAWGQTTVFSDDFSTNQNAAWTTSGAIGSSAWSVSRSGDDWGARRNTSPAQLELTNDASGTANVNGWAFAYTGTNGFSSPYNKTLNANSGLVTWYFNMRQIRTDPAGFASSSYGVAYILGTTSTTANNAGTGYAVVLGQSGSTDPIRLARFSGGLSTGLTDIITSNTSGLTDFGTEYLSIKVTYNPSDNTWELFLRNDGASAFTDPASGSLTSQGTATDGTYVGTNLEYMGAYWQGSTGANQTAFFDNVSVTAVPPPTVDWCNLQSPASGNIRGGMEYNVYARVYKAGVTDGAGQGANINAWIGRSTVNNNPAANPGDWTWVVASYNDSYGNNDEYMANIATGLTGGTYYYASRFQYNGGAFSYGGYNNPDGGIWDGSTNVSGTLTIDDTVDWCNLQWPENGSITLGGGFDVYAQIWEDGYTNGAGQAAHIGAWIGYSTVDNDPTNPANASDWTWVAASYNSLVTDNNDEYMLNLGAEIPGAGTYYYVSRFRIGSGSYYYGGYNGGFWSNTYSSGTGNKSGRLIVTGPVITVSTSTLTGFSYFEGSGPSAEQSFTVSGTNLTNNISIYPPTNYQISTGTGGAFSATDPITLTQSGGNVSETTIYVRLQAGLSVGSFIGDIGLASTGATGKAVSCSGEVLTLGGCATDLIISEYLEGSSNNKYIEIYNGTGSSVDLSDYRLRLYANGATTITSDVLLSGTLADGATKVYKNSSAIIYGGAADINAAVNFNGDDAIALYKISTSSNVDIFGRIGEDPGTAWTSGSHSTLDKTLVRKAFVRSGVTSNPASGFPTLASEWDVYNQDTHSYLGSHTMSCVCIPPTLAATGLGSTSITGASATISWTKGDGEKSLVIVRAGAAVSATPVDETTYLANNVYGDGQDLGSGNFVVYADLGSSFSLQGLLGGTTYHVAVFPYSCNPGDEDYFTTTPATTSFTTLPSQATGLTVICTDATSATITWNSPSGNYDGVIIGVRNSGTLVPHVLSVNPATLTANSVFGTPASQYGSTEPYSFVVYKGTDNTVTITGLTAGQPYIIRAYAYVGTTYATTQHTTSISSLGVPEVINASNTDGNAQSALSWTKPSAACHDEIMVVVKNGSSVGVTPSGDGSAYTANSVFGTGTEIAAGQFVCYKGTGINVTITGLTNLNTYYAKIFVRSGTQWSTGVELVLNPADITILEYGDLAILAVNTSVDYGGDVFGSEFSFVAFVDIVAETSIDFTDNGYERSSAGLWGDTEGVLRFTRKNSTVPKGTVITFVLKGNVANPLLGVDAWVYLGGELDNSDWTSSGISNGGAGFNLNKDDQIWIMQGGNWVNPSGTHNAYYTGNVLFGWSGTGWKAAPGYASTSGSTIFPGAECTTTNVAGLTNKFRVKYVGSLDPATRVEWIGRINNPGNWNGWAETGDYNTASPLYKQDGAALTITAGDLTVGKWAGYRSTDWFDCGNWGNLRVPSMYEDVVIDDTHDSNNNVIISGTAEEAYCASLTINSSTRTLTMSTAGTVLNIMGNFDIKTGNTFTQNNGTLNLYGNWINNGTYTVNGGTVAFVGSSAQEIISGVAPVFNNLTISNSSGVSATDNITVGGILSLTQGRLTTTGIVNVTNSANSAVSFASNSHVNGTLRRSVATGNYDFPTGYNSNVQNARINISSATGLTDITVNFNNWGAENMDINALGLSVDGTPLNTLLDAGFWTITPNVGFSNVNYSATLQLKASSNTGLLATQHTVLKRENALSAWTLEGSHTNTTQSIAGNVLTVVRTGLTSFSDFAVAKHDAFPLPIELLYFTAEKLDESILLKWATASEINNDYFTIERSSDLKNGIEIAKISGAGDSRTICNYYFEDNQPLRGINYYRLKQTDFDGSYDYSKWVAVDNNMSSGVLKILYLHQDNDLVALGIEAKPESLLQIQAVDIFGRIIYNTTLRADQTFVNYTFKPQQLSGKMIIIRVSDTETTETRKMFFR